ncbi:uncharacterized protein LY89DRAFT_451212 [Mollisia scopiformis]|uniref:Uncharacterized protein n=1 Tax=Mollisia scopiformis TaxID=149040 RepID=A0A194XKC2_MOLSC|nr:uncharacterized protein LY89DRAFT_451212 [Mollisia scopiformis]KUJ20660.1 hypothetical protein LY89DRAFT_451212 [Mollisia scopiformis]
MAQRAYRHRKETTITSLEKQVQDLRGTNEEMSNIFISLYDYAVGQGLLQREPEFGQQLQSTTERFLALAKSTAQEEGSHDEQPEETKQVESESARRTKATRASSKKAQEQSPKTSDAPVHPYGGYISRLSPSDSPVEEIPLDSQLQTYEHRPRPTELQVITRPTEDNASFPFDLMDLQQYRVDIPPMEDYSQNFFSQTQLPLPTTHSYAEFSFARRIQRASVERAYKLITAENPPEVRFKEVFGLTLRYETKENVIARLKKFLRATDKETLHEWRNPFVHIGGSGTFYPNHDSEIETDLMPKFRTGYSMGPFNPTVGQAQELMLEDMKCTLPGFDGEFFDANDVEGYLRGRGLEIPPSADYVTAELDASILDEAISPRSDSVDTLPTIPSPKTPKSPLDRSLVNNGLGQRYDYNKPNINGFPFPITLWSMDASPKDTSNIDPIFNTLPSQSTSNRAAESVRSFTNKRLVTINVNVLVDGILSRAVCLGRGAGFRLSDVNAAIVAAIKAGF